MPHYGAHDIHIGSTVYPVHRDWLGRYHSEIGVSWSHDRLHTKLSRRAERRVNRRARRLMARGNSHPDNPTRNGR